jgi:hypothetical protein
MGIASGGIEPLDGNHCCARISLSKFASGHPGGGDDGEEGQGTGSAQRAAGPYLPVVARDVADERTSARQLIDAELMKLRSLRGQLALELIAWDDPAARIPMLATETPQDSVNAARPRPAPCDIVIVVLWSRMGTPLPDNLRKPNGEPYLSGTEWEYEDAVNSREQPRPQVLVYRPTGKPRVELDDPDFENKRAQFRQVETFFARFRNADGSLAGGVNDYATPAEFKTLLRGHLEDILCRCLQSSGDKGEPPPTTAEIPAEYYGWLRHSFEKIELLGAKEGRAVTLDHVYVPALTRPAPAPAAKKRGRKKPREEAEEQKPIPLLQRLDQESLYVPAPAGAGKSTFCRWAVLQSVAGTELTHPVPAPEEFAEPVPTALRSRLPLLVPLREFWRSMDCGRGERIWYRSDLARALADWVDIAKPGGLTGALLSAHVDAGSAFLLFDGLDEVPVSQRAQGVTTYPRELLLSGLADALPYWQKAGNRILLTSRSYGLDEAGLHRLGLERAPLEPLPEPLRDLFVARWFHTLGKTEQTPGLIETIRGRDDLAPLIENPMLLTALCVLYDSGGRLPEDRYDLYKSIVSNVLYNRYPGDARERQPVERRLEAIAHGMHTGECAGARRLTPAAEISWVEAERLLARFAELNPVYESDQVEAAVRREELLTRSGLLVPLANERAAFYHLSFQEFLAAQRIARTPGDVEQIFRARGGVPEWRPTLLFLFAAQIAIWDAQWGLDLLGQLIADQDRTAVKANAAPAVFIAEALELCLAKKYAVSEEVKEDFRRLSLEAIEDEIALQARQALGLCLGRVGDPRIFDLRDPRAYVEVPAGTYPYGAQGKSVEIATPFRLGRYPVTNGQYQAFIDDGGYRDRRWWSDGGWKWLHSESAKPRPMGSERSSLRSHLHVCAPVPLTRGRKSPSPGYGATGAGTLPTSPWWASASGRSKRAAPGAGGRLPREEEWEAAARGREGHAYPWGNDWQDGICNTRSAGLGVTSPVGLFPRARQRTWASKISPGTSGSGAEACTAQLRSRTRMPVCCAAGPGTTIGTSRAPPSASGATRTTGTTTSGFVWCVRPHHCALATESAATRRQRRVSAASGASAPPRAFFGLSPRRDPGRDCRIGVAGVTAGGAARSFFAVCCVAGPGTTTRTTRAQPTATGTTRTTGTTTSASAISPRSSGPTVTCTPSISSSRGSSAAAPRLRRLSPLRRRLRAVQRQQAPTLGLEGGDHRPARVLAPRHSRDPRTGASRGRRHPLARLRRLSKPPPGQGAQGA